MFILRETTYKWWVRSPFKLWRRKNIESYFLLIFTTIGKSCQLVVYLFLWYAISWFSPGFHFWHSPRHMTVERPCVPPTPGTKLIGLRDVSSVQDPMIGSQTSSWLNHGANQMQEDIAWNFWRKKTSHNFLNRLTSSSFWIWARKNIGIRICWVLFYSREKANVISRRMPTNQVSLEILVCYWIEPHLEELFLTLYFSVTALSA